MKIVHNDLKQVLSELTFGFTKIMSSHYVIFHFTLCYLSLIVSYRYIYSQLGCSQPITTLRYHPAFSYIGRLRPLRDGHPCHLVYVARKSTKQSTQETDELNHTLLIP